MINLQKSLVENLENRFVEYPNGCKELLSYSKETGFEIKKLNTAQLLLRNLFGLYKSTHLNFITKKISKHTDKNEKAATYQEIIASAWKKKNIVTFGNSTIAKADIIGIAEKHGDISFRTYVTRLINSLYSEGDIILIEGLKAGIRIESDQYHLTKDLKSDCIVQGWEPENFESMSSTVFEKDNEIYTQLISCVTSFKNLCEGKNKLNDQETIELQIKIDELKININSLNEYYKSNSQLILNAGKILDTCYERWKCNSLSASGEHGDAYYAIILKIMTEFEMKREAALYKNMPSANTGLIDKWTQLRNDSLVKEINAAFKPGRRVFVIAGASHLLEFPLMTTCKQVKDALKQQKFSIITNKEYLSWATLLMNRDLQYTT